MWTDFRIRLRAIFRRRSAEFELDDELKFHIEQQTEKYIKAGYARQEAGRQARLDLGGPEQIKEECRQARGVRLFDELCGDVRYALRQLRRTPVFTFVAVLTLAIGIGTNTAIFTLLDAVMLRRLPVSQPEQLRQLSWTADRAGFAPSYIGGGVSIDATGNRARDAFAYPICEYLNRHTSSFSGVFCWTFQDMTLSVAGRTETVRVQRVSSSYFRGLALDTLMGRIFGPEDSQPGASPVAVISYGFWQRVRAGEPNIVGQTIALDGASVPIVGVMPREFLGINPAARTDIVLPIPHDDGALRDSRKWQFQIFGRLKPGETERAQTETKTLLRQAILAAPQDRPYDLPRLWLTDGSRGLQGLQRSVSTPLVILASGAGLILVIGCSNLAGLLLARAANRKREIATRLSLGGRRARIVRQLLSESILLSLLGGGAGVILLYMLPAWLLAGLRRGYQNSGVDLSPDPQVFFVACTLSMLTAIAFGLAPALRATRLDLVSLLKGMEKSSPRSNHFTVGRALVTVQVALSLILLVACGLFIRTVANLQSMPKGFRAEGLLTFQLNPARAGYPRSRLMDFYHDVTNRLESLSGVSSVSLSMNGILTDSESGASIRLPGTPQDGPSENARLQAIGPRFFETMATPLLVGRDFRWQDRTETVIPVIINEALAKKLFPGTTAVGEKVILNVFGEGPGAEIIGVVADAKYNDLRAAPPPTVYVSFTHYNVGSMIFVVRSELDTAALSAGIRQAIQDIDPSLPVDQVMTQQAYIDRKMSRERMISTMLAGFGAVALLLAALGIYGTLAWSVSRRTSEIGIRMALGAQRWSLIRSVVSQSLLPVIAGIVLGLCGAAALNRLFANLLFEMTPSDPVTVLPAATILMLTAIAAAFAPARRASRIDPMRALRHE